MGAVSFHSGGYNLHWFSDALRLVTFVSFIKQTFCLFSVCTSCSHKHLGPSPQGYICVNHNTLYVTLQPCPVRGYTALRRTL